MKTTSAVCPTEFTKQAKKTISLAFALCENRIMARKNPPSPELRALSAAALSLEKAVAVFIAAERLSK